MPRIDAREVLEEYQGVYIGTGYLFVSTTGKLLDGYVNCEVVYPYDFVVRELVRQLLEPFVGEVDGIVCPATGDIVLMREAVRQANGDFTGSYYDRVVGVWADRHGEGSDSTYHIERNGYENAIRGRRILVVNDRISQGGTTRKVIGEARRLDCDVLGVATLAGVSSATKEALDVPFVHSLCTIDVKAFDVDAVPDELRTCRIVVDEPLGHGAEFQRDNPHWPSRFVKLMTGGEPELL